MRHSYILVLLILLISACSKAKAPSQDDANLSVSFLANISDKLDDWSGQSNAASQTRGTAITDANMRQFGVYCFHTGTTPWVDVANTALPNKLANIAVTRTGDTWSYENPVQWGGSQLYTFFGYSPYATGLYQDPGNPNGNNIQILTPDDVPGKPRLSYATLDYVPSQVDLLFAAPIYNIYPVSAPVKMRFRHALSQIRFTAWAPRSFVKVTAIHISDLQYSATFDIDGTLTPDPLTPIKDFDLADLEVFLSTDETKKTDLTAGGNSFLLLPQDLTTNTTAQITVYYEIAGTQLSSTPYTIIENWEPGKSYTYNLKLGDAPTEEMIITSVDITEWVLDGEEDLEAGPPPPLFDPANSYIVAPGKGLRFNATVQGNGAAGAVAMDPKSVQVLWQTGDGVTPLIESVSMGANGEATVQTNSAVAGGGNAVIAAYDGPNGTGDILWSWHIWVTDYNPDGTKSYGLGQNSKADVPGGEVHTYATNFMAKNPGKVIMDRNLGATKAYYAAPPAVDNTNFGLLYQWGRKDPFPGWDGVNTSAPASIKLYAANGTTDITATVYKNVAGPVSVTTAIANPGNFYHANASPYDWNSTSNDALWGDGAAKSIYDPCPLGWRIAPDGTWSDFGTNAYAAPFFYYINGVKQTARGTPAFVASGRNGRFYEPSSGTVKAWYPAPGYRLVTTGVLGNSGYGGYSWSSTAFMTNSTYLGFNSGSLNSSSADYRANSYPVRCIQETTPPPPPPPAGSYIPTTVLEAAGWPADKLPATGLQVAMRGDKQMPGTGTPGTDAQMAWKTESTATAGVESANTLADNTQFGVGKSNTDAMIAAGADAHPAAQYCRDMGEEWYLPNIKELKLIYDNQNLLGSSYTFNRFSYWSSTELRASSGFALFLNSANGGISNTSKVTPNFVRCVREI